MRTFENYICNVYTFSTTIVDGSKVQGKTVKYSDIPCAFWKNSKRMLDNETSYQNSSNSYEINLQPIYPVFIQDIIVVNSVEYVVTDVIEHHNHKGILDNYQVFISKTL